MKPYLTVLKTCQAELTEKRSRFIATICHCETEEEAAAFIDSMRSKYWDARHNVYAYSLRQGGLCRFSDDGEPHGTAGKPVFDVLCGSGATDVAVVVTRYFGGILLGTGGLVHAYSKTAKDAFEAAEIVEMIPCTLFKTQCDYTDHQKLSRLIEDRGGKIEETVWTDKVTVEYAFKDSDIEGFLADLTEAFSARLTACRSGERLTPFKLEKV